MQPHTLEPKQNGFTLIEAIIVVAIIGMLAAIANTSYQDSIKKAQRTDAKNALLEIAVEMERCFRINSVYTARSSNATGSRCKVLSHRANTLAPDYQSSEQGYAALTIVVTDTTYILTATSNNSDDTQCTSFSLHHTGVRRATGSLGNDCW